jgi:hypothetical protein
MKPTLTLRARPHTTPSLSRRPGGMRRAAAELTPHAIEQIAQRVAQLLREHQHTQAAPTTGRLLDATELARHLGVTRTWVYEHASRLGAIRLGAGTKARLRFDLHTATAALAGLHEHDPRPADTTSQSTQRRGRPRRRPPTTAPLLPIHPSGTRGIMYRVVFTFYGGKR